MTTAESRALEWLSNGEVRPTRQRVLLASLLIGDGQNRHVCAESLFEAASELPEAVSLATVYNTLRLFCKAGLMTEVAIDGHKSYFDTRTDDHPHYYWEDRGEITDAPKNAVKFVDVPEIPDGTEVSRVDIVIRLREK